MACGFTLGAIFEPWLGPSWLVREPSGQEALGPGLAYPEAMLARIGAMLGLFWPRLGGLSAHVGATEWKLYFIGKILFRLGKSDIWGFLAAMLAPCWG